MRKNRDLVGALVMGAFLLAWSRFVRPEGGIPPARQEVGAFQSGLAT